MVDSCLNESELSADHKTMHLNINLGIPPAINLIWDHYKGDFSFSTYYVLRYTALTGWDTLGALASNLTSFTDPSPPNEDLYYFVEVKHPTGCDPNLSKILVYNSAQSNVSNRMNPGSCTAPVAGFTVTTTNLIADFTDTSATTGTTTWSWNFGDGSPVDNNQNPSHTYAADSTYNVCLTVTDSCGNITSCNNITVADTTTGISEPLTPGSVNIYPNPYTGQTQITYSLTEKANVTLKVLNVLGKKVQVLVNETQNSGKYNYSFSAKEQGYTSGVYILKLIVDDRFYTMKLIEY